MFTRILIPLDRSSIAEEAIRPAAAIARASNGTIDVLVVHQADSGTDSWRDERSYAAAVARDISARTRTTATHAVLAGDPVATICRRASDMRAELLVMTSHGQSAATHTWRGSVAEGVIRQPSIPILLLRPLEGDAGHGGSQHLFRHILVPLDGSDFSLEVLSHAKALAQTSGAQVTALRVVQPVPQATSSAGPSFVYPPQTRDVAATDRLVAEAKAWMESVLRSYESRSGLIVASSVIVADSAAEAIVDFATVHGVDLVAMSTHGRGASHLLTGGVADKIIRGSTLPMLLRRPAGIGDSRSPTANDQIPDLQALAGITL